jgi:hypothetical protein
MFATRSFTSAGSQGNNEPGNELNGPCQAGKGSPQMQRVVSLYALMLICLLADGAAFGQSSARPAARKACPFSIIGMWRSSATTATNPFFYSFSPDGWVRLMGHSPDTLPQNFELIAEMKYRLDSPARPKRLELTAMGGNEVFPAGMTAMEITEYSDDSLTLADPQSGEQTRWVREQTHRYFLTFAARNGPPQSGGPAFAMWTVLDGRQPEIEALGVQSNKDQENNILTDFGPIPAELYNQIIEASDADKKNNPDKNVLMRFELTPAEFETTHQIYQTWNKQAKAKALPYADAYLNGMEFLRQVAESLNRCGEKVKLLQLTQRERDEMVAKHTLPQYTLEYIRAMRKKNDELHVNDAVFPWQWRPMIQVAGQ